MKIRGDSRSGNGYEIRHVAGEGGFDLCPCAAIRARIGRIRA